MAFSLGLDFGTNSVRALIVDCSDGREVHDAFGGVGTPDLGRVMKELLAIKDRIEG